MLHMLNWISWFFRLYYPIHLTSAIKWKLLFHKNTLLLKWLAQKSVFSFTKLLKECGICGVIKLTQYSIGNLCNRNMGQNHSQHINTSKMKFPFASNEYFIFGLKTVFNEFTFTSIRSINLFQFTNRTNWKLNGSNVPTSISTLFEQIHFLGKIHFASLLSIQFF